MPRTPEFHVSELRHPASYDSSWHSHDAGQLTQVNQGVLLIETSHGRWLIPCGRVGWIPPRQRHTAFSRTAISGHSIYLHPKLCLQMPDTPCVLEMTDLGATILGRLFTQPENNHIQSALMEVLMNELNAAEQEPWQLPIPQDARLQKLTMLILKDVSNDRTIADWSNEIGMSTRSLSRRFSEETGMTFVRWRQLARLLQAMEWLQMGRSVEWVAQACGYSNTSAFITVFKQYMGNTPGKWVHYGS
ncbi:AraC family transcriptional regulator [Gynuella sp.]|uniref:AraC family transcriptional regulator n=1 Tax=Gynuella sp. TaxID=2969146 RepID=UPI003D0CC032